MATPSLKIGIVGRGPEARDLAERLSALPGLALVGWADEAAGPGDMPGPDIPSFADHADLIRHAGLEALLILTSHPGHYRPAMDALQAGCHVYLDRPFTAGVQEAVDIAGLARGHGLKVVVGGTFRLLPTVAGARGMLEGGAIGPVRMVTVVASQPGSHEDGAGAVVDALLWTTGQPALEVAAFRGRPEDRDGVTVASARLGGDIAVTLAISGGSPVPSFEIIYHGEAGRLRVTGSELAEAQGGEPWRALSPAGPGVGIIESFVAAITSGDEPCCPAEGAVDTARLLEAITRSASIGQVVRLA